MVVPALAPPLCHICTCVCTAPRPPNTKHTPQQQTPQHACTVCHPLVTKLPPQQQQGKYHHFPLPCFVLSPFCPVNCAPVHAATLHFQKHAHSQNCVSAAPNGFLWPHKEDLGGEKNCTLLQPASHSQCKTHSATPPLDSKTQSTFQTVKKDDMFQCQLLNSNAHGRTHQRKEHFHPSAFGAAAQSQSPCGHSCVS